MALDLADDTDRLSSIRSRVTSLINATNIGTSISILVQAIDNKALKHQDTVVALAAANIGLGGAIVIFALALSACTLPKNGSWTEYYQINYFISLLTAASIGVSMTLAAYSGTAKS